MQIPGGGPSQRRERACHRGQRASGEMARAHQPGAQPAFILVAADEPLLQPVRIPRLRTPDGELQPSRPVSVPQERVFTERGSPRRNHPRPPAQVMHLPRGEAAPAPAQLQSAVIMPDDALRQQQKPAPVRC
jgi:hypothetical protein